MVANRTEMLFDNLFGAQLIGAARLDMDDGKTLFLGDFGTGTREENGD